MASTKDLNMNISVSNVNMFLEAFSNWNRLNEMKASSKIKVQDVNLTVGVSGKPGKSIIQDVSGLSLVIRRSLRDLWHQIPNIEAAIAIWSSIDYIRHLRKFISTVEKSPVLRNSSRKSTDRSETSRRSTDCSEPSRRSTGRREKSRSSVHRSENEKLRSGNTRYREALNNTCSVF